MFHIFSSVQKIPNFESLLTKSLLHYSQKYRRQGGNIFCSAMSPETSGIITATTVRLSSVFFFFFYSNLSTPGSSPPLPPPLKVHFVILTSYLRHSSTEVEKISLFPNVRSILGLHFMSACFTVSCCYIGHYAGMST